MKFRPSVIALAAPLLLALPLSPAFAEGPMNTDDAGTLDKGGMKVEGVLGRDDKERGGELVFGFSPIENVEVGIAVARSKDHSADPDTDLRGEGISIKWVPYQNDTGWSLGASFGYGRTRVDETPDNFVAKEYSITGLASYRLDNGQVLHMNLGAARVKEHGKAQDNASNTLGTWGIGYEFPLIENLQLTVETFGEENSGPDKAIGLRYEIVDGLKAYGAVGRGNDRSFGNLGLAWEF